MSRNVRVWGDLQRGSRELRIRVVAKNISPGTHPCSEGDKQLRAVPGEIALAHFARHITVGGVVGKFGKIVV